MKNIISYCLYGHKDRYWRLIPSLFVSNKEMNKDHILRIYAHEEIKNNKYYSIIDFLIENEIIEVEFINEDYKNTYLTCWRVKPLWDEDVRYVYCRDIDSLPTPFGTRVINYFQNSNYSLHSMRSHPLHTIPLMAGLCGFDRFKLKRILNSSFEEYIEYGKKNCPYCSDWRWGCDQELLCKFFIYSRNAAWQKNYLEICVPNKIGKVHPLSKHKVRSSCIDYKIINKINLKGINPLILNICESNYGKFIGQPLEPRWNVSVEHVQKINKKVLSVPIENAHKIREFIYKDKTMKDFFIG